MEINTKFFGVMPYKDEEIITFEDGIFGFGDNKKYLLIRFDDENGSILSLQNIEDEHLAFVVINPFWFMPEYNPQLGKDELEKLGTNDVEKLLFYNICAIKDDMQKSTVNLRCPLVINGESHKAVQSILDNSDYKFKHPFYEFAKEK